jgi:hypothetical protein
MDNATIIIYYLFNIVQQFIAGFSKVNATHVYYHVNTKEKNRSLNKAEHGKIDDVADSV